MLTLNSVLDYGKYKDKKMTVHQIMANDPVYLNVLVRQGTIILDDRTKQTLERYLKTQQEKSIDDARKAATEKPETPVVDNDEEVNSTDENTEDTIVDQVETEEGIDVEKDEESVDIQNEEITSSEEIPGDPVKVEGDTEIETQGETKEKEEVQSEDTKKESSKKDKKKK